MPDFVRARRIMVDTQLRTNSVTNRRLLSAMGEIPRELFVPENRRDLAYIDEQLPLGQPGRALTAPTAFARLVQLADVRPEDTVLDFGCGTGYSTAVLARLATSVVGIEPIPSLAARARQILQGLGIANAEIRSAGPDARGMAPGEFDVIVVETTVSEVPKALWAHLRDRGRLVAVIGQGMTAVAHLYIKTGAEIAGRADFNLRLPAQAGDASGEFVF